MQTNFNTRYYFLRVLLLISFIFSLPTNAAMKVKVGNVDVYFSVLPSQIILTYPKDNPARDMHGGVPKQLQHHLMVSVLDSKTHKRIPGIIVTVKVESVGKKVVTKKLEPMLMNGVFTYGKYFKLDNGAHFIAKVTVKLPDKKTPISAQFDWWNIHIAKRGLSGTGGVN